MPPSIPHVRLDEAPADLGKLATDLDFERVDLFAGDFDRQPLLHTNLGSEHDLCPHLQGDHAENLANVFIAGDRRGDGRGQLRVGGATDQQRLDSDLV